MLKHLRVEVLVSLAPVSRVFDVLFEQFNSIHQDEGTDGDWRDVDIGQIIWKDVHFDEETCVQEGGWEEDAHDELVDEVSLFVKGAVLGVSSSYFLVIDK